tara:strand:- start:1458 stop:1742 length:285 start_codon:yes stop_codon:yes gene_type:complete
MLTRGKLKWEIRENLKGFRRPGVELLVVKEEGVATIIDISMGDPEKQGTVGFTFDVRNFPVHDLEGDLLSKEEMDVLVEALIDIVNEHNEKYSE